MFVEGLMPAGNRTVSRLVAAEGDGKPPARYRIASLARTTKANRTQRSSQTQPLSQRSARAGVASAVPVRAAADQIRRFAELEQIYEGSPLLNDPWFAKFQLVQRILRDRSRVDEHLRTLADYMRRNRESLSETLRGFEGGRNPGSLPQLTDFVPADAFADLVSKGEIFEDLVNPRHGMQTHRLQWFIVAQEMGDNWAKDVYRESVNPRWRVTLAGDEKNMWDFIVDQLGVPPGDDFTMPSNLETYLTEPRSIFKRLRPVTQDVIEGHGQIREEKADLRRRYPSEDQYTASMKTIVKRLGLFDRDQPHGPTAQARRRNQKRAVVAEIELERIQLTTNVGGVVRTITWTGWIAREYSQQQPNDFPRLIPTVAYVQ
jgi:hypothetical protein